MLSYAQQERTAGDPYTYTYASHLLLQPPDRADSPTRSLLVQLKPYAAPSAARPLLGAPFAALPTAAPPGRSAAASSACAPRAKPYASR